MSSFLFVSDLDHTLVGDRAALETLNEQLDLHRQQHGTKIVYATGRSLFLYRQLCEEQTLLPPDVLIASVGTAIYPNPDEDTADKEWAKMLSQGWDRQKVSAIASQFDQLVPQPESEQGDFKLSYNIDPQQAKTVLSRLKSELSAQNFHLKVIYSGSRDVDILPQQADKGLAVRFLQQRWGIDEEKTAVCGDSGNDIALFSTGKSRGIIVGNAQPELRQWYAANQTDYRYFAQASCSGGILEGLQHFGFLP